MRRIASEAVFLYENNEMKQDMLPVQGGVQFVKAEKMQESMSFSIYTGFLPGVPGR